METNEFGKLGPVSALALGSAGLIGDRGTTSHDDAKATLKAAADAGITLFDIAPADGNGDAQKIFAQTFNGTPPPGTRIATKCLLGSPSADEVPVILDRALDHSLKTMKIDHIDLFYLHSQICPDDFSFSVENSPLAQWATRWSVYENAVIPAMEKLVKQGRIGAWGLAGTGLPKSIMDALRHDIKPAAVQAIANLLDSPGDLRTYIEPPEPRNIIRTAGNNDVAVQGIRPLGAGALSAHLNRLLAADNPLRTDYEKAAPYRTMCSQNNQDSSETALRYALALPGIHTLTIAPSSPAMLKHLLEAYAKGPLQDAAIKEIDALGLARPKLRMPID